MLARLLRPLAPFQPTLIGSFPLGLQVDGSDLDITCTCDDLDAFERALRTALSDLGIAPPRIERSPAVVVAAFELGATFQTCWPTAAELLAILRRTLE